MVKSQEEQKTDPMDLEDILDNELFGIKAPIRGGYGSELEVEQQHRPVCVRLRLIADWMPRSETPEVDIIDWDPDTKLALANWDNVEWLCGNNGWISLQQLTDQLGDAG